MTSGIILSEQDRDQLRARQQLLNVERFKIQQLEFAFTIFQQQMFSHYGLDPNQRYQVDDRGVVTPFESPAPLQPSSPNGTPENTSNAEPA